MNVIASSLLRENKYGLVFRVFVGAALSTIDAATDIYVISTYVASEASEPLEHPAATTRRIRIARFAS